MINLPNHSPWATQERGNLEIQQQASDVIPHILLCRQFMGTQKQSSPGDAWEGACESESRQTLHCPEAGALVWGLPYLLALCVRLRWAWEGGDPHPHHGCHLSATRMRCGCSSWDTLRFPWDVCRLSPPLLSSQNWLDCCYFPKFVP